VACPNEEDLAALLEGDLDATERSALNLHVEGCSECRVLWRRLVGSSTAGLDGQPDAIAATVDQVLLQTQSYENDDAGAGQCVGRYRLRKLIGSGGMGRVYAARDPELDREIAIKLLRADIDTQNPELRTRLLREAQAMARLSHPNVIAVHDVGLHRDHVFIAMELIDGQTLRQWLDERPRPWQDVLRVAVQAGRGLAAAHKAGVVHRDFKPDNVMIGRDGSVRVLDFGLARGVADESRSPGEDTANSVLKGSLTRTGGFIGTPAYMAPEQFQKSAATPQSDQFSFCIVLYRAIWGEAPFAGDSIEALAEAVINGRLRAPSQNRRVPGWLRDAVLRGLATDPAQRWPSMDELLATAMRDSPSKRRRWIVAGAAGAVLVALALGYRDLRRRESLVCRGAERKLVGIWDDARKQKMHAAFATTSTPFAEDAFRGAARALDAYAGAWVEAHTDACEATRVRREQSEELLDLRMECLTERLQEAKAQLELLTSADAKTVEKAVQMTSALAPVSVCGDVAALRAPVRPPNEIVRAEVATLRDDLARVKALYQAGHFAESRVKALALVEATRKLGYRPLHAEALVALGESQLGAGQPKDAETSLHEATLAAEAGHADKIFAEALILLIRATADQTRYAEGEKLGDLALAVIERVGGEDRLRARLADMRSLLAAYAGRSQEAVVAGQQALALWQKLPDVGPADLATAHMTVGTTLLSRAQYLDAIPYFRRALALWEQAGGPNHPNVATVLNNLGAAQSGAEMFEEARASLERTLSIRLRTFDPMNPKVGSAWGNLAVALAGLGRYEEAVADYDRALTITERAHNDAEIAHQLTGMAQALLALHRPREALERAERALAIRRRLLGDAHPRLAYTLILLAMADADLGQFARGLGEAQAAVRILEKTVEASSPELTRAQVEVARAQLGLHAVHDALPILERAVQLRREDHASPFGLADAEFLLARALWQTGKHARALELGEQARAHFRSDKTGRAEELGNTVQAWLEARGNSRVP
jgi:tetratricopeptide (TPR) repeat protein/tRNA A-37 threonylcarbamoyl transferase component Bud32